MNLGIQERKNGLTLLTIEDETGLRKSIADYFEDSGFTVIEASDGHEGLEAFRNHKPDIVFADLCMPKVHGLEIIPVMHQESPYTPVIVVSGAGMLQDAVESMKRGAWDYVSKPIRELGALEQLAFKMLARSEELKRESEYNSNLQQELSNHQDRDSLTGLPNRKLFKDHCGQILDQGAAGCLGLIDLDNFKAIKESFDHESGDQLLMEVAERLGAKFTGSSVLARLGGDEFAFLTTYSAQPSSENQEEVVKSIRSAFAAPFDIKGEELLITASMGLSCWPADGNTIDELLKKADIAMSRAKEQGQNSCRIYSSEITARSTDWITLQTRLRRALEKNEFILHYQPQMDIGTTEIKGVEALIRWQPEGEPLVPPGAFIPALEESGLIIQVGEWALRTACNQLRQWNRSGHPPFMMSVNVTALQFHSPGFAEKVADIIAETEIDPEYLCLELTESIVMKDVADTIDTLTKLRKLGIALSLDDFGTGYSSLCYLRKMPISELKIDRSFIATLPEDQNNAMIVSTIISMANCLNMRVVAEGVETSDQLEYLRANHCHIAQGYLFSRPIPAEDFHI
ncbi:putative signaling protein [Geobacter sp. OR-1]|uniref:GGDEF/EAL domain-containing response regulator n=1 Tax=Geobacter sp. OR-1 TaxID=1266765 RepID=UPI000541A4F1|nr:EAL domain-containing protein [Geobacter sp. OR-1]GAM08651.1 putative signaling protein [Geobacter sp. OR-1]